MAVVTLQPAKVHPSMRRWLDPNEAWKRPLVSLAVLFCVWKCFLFVIIDLSPGIGYDTSADIYTGTIALKHSNWLDLVISRVQRRLTSWDALYYAGIGTRDYLYEQEWAFSWGYTRLVLQTKDVIKTYFPPAQPLPDTVLSIWIAIFFSNVAHFLSVYALFCIAQVLSGKDGGRIAFVAACLHITSTAGVFLSAPYSESLFACLHMTGILIFAQVWHSLNYLAGLPGLLLSGLMLGSSTSVRSNGLLSGALFIIVLIRLWLYNPYAASVPYRLFQSIFVVLAGLLVGGGVFVPQWIAYKEYCELTKESQTPLWCLRTIPSIFTWVQSHYWNVGFLRYWTVSNIPLFVLAAPMLYTLVRSSAWALRGARPGEKAVFQQNELLAVIAIPQILLAVTALTSYHVQIILRIASGYPLWYLWVAQTLFKEEASDKYVSSLIRWMVIYPLVQAALFASFLPPA